MYAQGQILASLTSKINTSCVLKITFASFLLRKFSNSNKGPIKAKKLRCKIAK